MKKIVYVLSLCSIVLLSACTATGEKFTKANYADVNKAKLYIFRPSSPPYLLKPTILINNVDVAELSNKSYFEIDVAPGVVNVLSDWSFLSGVPDGKIEFEAQAGEEYFVYVTSSANIAGFIPLGSNVVAPIADNKGSIALVDEKFALNKMTECKRVMLKAEFL